MKKRDAILKLESLEWAFECHLTSKLPSDLKLTDEFMQLFYERMKELKDTIQALPGGTPNC
jgi:hypothetical protein